MNKCLKSLRNSVFRRRKTAENSGKQENTISFPSRKRKLENRHKPLKPLNNLVFHQWKSGKLQFLQYTYSLENKKNKLSSFPKFTISGKLKIYNNINNIYMYIFSFPLFYPLRAKKGF